jgi:hypothetical protein
MVHGPSPASASGSHPHPLLARADDGVLLVGITPPRCSTPPERVAEIARTTLARLAPLDLDGLVLYDIDDESDRNPGERPFPYLPTLDPVTFHAEHLGSWRRPTVIYRCVGKYPEAELSSWLRSVDVDRVLGVLVGASSRHKPVHTTLPRAHTLRNGIRPDLTVGGVTIPERHTGAGDEHHRILVKQDRGCDFFVSQVVYDVDAAKNLLSDYAYTCAERGLVPRPVILTLSVCGSLKTLAFLRWLGVSVPRWLENELRHASDPLAESYQQCLAHARELTAFCRRLRMPFGFNVESVSIRKVEIEASVALAGELRGLLDGH